MQCPRECRAITLCVQRRLPVLLRASAAVCIAARVCEALQEERLLDPASRSPQTLAPSRRRNRDGASVHVIAARQRVCLSGRRLGESESVRPRGAMQPSESRDQEKEKHAPPRSDETGQVALLASLRATQGSHTSTGGLEQRRAVEEAASPLLPLAKSRSTASRAITFNRHSTTSCSVDHRRSNTNPNCLDPKHQQRPARARSGCPFSR